MKPLSSSAALFLENIREKKMEYAQDGLAFRTYNQFNQTDRMLDFAKSVGSAYLGSRNYHDAYFNARIDDPEEAARKSNKSAIISAGLTGINSLFTMYGESQDYKREMERIAMREAMYGYQRVPYDRYAYNYQLDNSYNNVAFKMGGVVNTEIPERLRKLGFKKVGHKIKSTRPGKKWMVLAQKDGKFRIVHGGTLEPLTTKKKKAFWERVGGKDTPRAKNPFSPLYWHKEFNI